MNKSIYEFTKIFGFLFLISGICFFINGMNFIAILALATAFIIFLISSDWFFDTFNLTNHNGFVIFATFILIFVNAYFIYQEICNTTLFVKVTDKDKETYSLYEQTLNNDIAPCVNNHNSLIEKMKSDSSVSADEIKAVHKSCYVALDKLNSEKISNVETAVVKDMSAKIQDNFKQIVVNLTTYNYSKKEPQESLIVRANKAQADLQNNLNKNRRLLDIKQDSNTDIFIKF